MNLVERFTLLSTYFCKYKVEIKPDAYFLANVGVHTAENGPSKVFSEIRGVQFGAHRANLPVA